MSYCSVGAISSSEMTSYNNAPRTSVGVRQFTTLTKPLTTLTDKSPSSTTSLTPFTGGGGSGSPQSDGSGSSSGGGLSSLKLGGDFNKYLPYIAIAVVGILLLKKR